MQITITRRELLELWHGLPTLANLKGFKLGYAIARTKAKLKIEIEALEEAVKPGKDFEEYEKKRVSLCQKFADKDDQGAPVVQGNQFVFGENRKAFDEEMAPLNVEYSQAIEGRQKQVEGYTDGMKEKITVEVHQLTVNDVSEDVSVAQMEVLYYFIT